MRKNAALVVFLTLLHLALRLAKGDYTVSLRLSSYSNPSHRHANGGCCDFGFSLFLGPYCDQCDNYFAICAADDSCVRTGEVGGDRLTFKNRVGNLRNPVLLSVPGQWSGFLRLVIDVYDNDFFRDDFVDQFRLTIPLSLNTASGVLTYWGRFGRGTIAFSVAVACSDDYYGSDCSVLCAAGDTYTCGPDGGKVCLPHYYGEDCAAYCQPVVGRYECSSEGDKVCVSGYYGPECEVFCEGRDDEGGHYSCGEEGQKVCLAGWTRPENNCVTSLCDPPCNTEGGRCGASGECECEEGWGGEVCEECQPHPQCSLAGGYCRKPNECHCKEGFSGEFCSIITPTTTPTAPPTATPTITPTVASTETSSATPTFSVTLSTVIAATTSVTTPTATPTHVIPGETPTGFSITTSTVTVAPMSITTPTATPTHVISGETPTEFSITTSTITVAPMSITTPTATPTSISTGLPITTPTATPTTISTGLPVTTPNGNDGEGVEGGEGGREGEDDFTGGLQSEEGGDGQLVGGVVGGLLSLLALAVLVVTLFYCLWMVRRQRRRKQAGQTQLIEEDNTLTVPLVGENPIYMDQVMGSHVLERSSNSHQFDNPLYHSHSQEAGPPSGGQQQGTSSGSTHTYSSIDQHRMSSLYLPGDDSPLTASLSSTEGSHQDTRYSYVEHRRNGHRPHQPASCQLQQTSLQRSALFNYNSHEQRPGAGEGETARPNSLHTQYFHLPLNGML